MVDRCIGSMEQRMPNSVGHLSFEFGNSSSSQDIILFLCNLLVCY
jgi:hypothetical protein